MSVSAVQLAQHVAKAIAKSTAPEVFAYSWRTPWKSGDVLQVGDRALPIRYCGSPLELREALLTESQESKVILVGFEETELGQDVLARLFRHRLLHVDRWQMAMDVFGARDIDPRLYPLTWIPDALLEAAPRRRGPPLAVLTYDEALGTCVRRALAVESELDLESVVESLERRPAAWGEQPEERREAYRRFLVDRLGSVMSAVLGAVSAGNAHALTAIGLACEVLFAPEQPDADLRDARVRLEGKMGGQRLSRADGLKWGDTARRIVTRLQDDAKRQHVCRTASDLIRGIGAAAYIGTSTVLPEALDRRLEDLGDALRAFLKNPETLPEVERAAATVSAHALIPPYHPGPETADMVARLCRRERLVAGVSTAHAKHYLEHGAWEDFARRGLRAVRPESLGKQVSKLLERIAARRAEADRKFADELAQRAANGATPVGLLPVEKALVEVVAPVAATVPTLLVVLDGMSWDVYLPLAQELHRTGWSAWTRENAAESLLATLPSVTECSRMSLLSGRLARGSSAQEKSAFASHERLVQVSRTGRPPVLLHKAELQSGNQLSPQAIELLGDPDRQIVGVVINAIDDTLAKSEQVRIDWTVETIPLLAAILDQARMAGRAVILTSDHGHVLERDAEYRNVGDGERWRMATTDVAEGEIRMTGPRVSALIGADIIVPFTEGLRYCPKKNGYHGGATLQEMLVPVGIWTTGAAPGEGFRQTFISAPEWWAAETSEPRKAKAPAAATGDLFASPKESKWIEELLVSATFARQKERVGRLALDTPKLQALLGCLDERGGRAGVEVLAAAIQMPSMRMRGVLSVLQRMLNVDGFPVVTMEPGSGMVLLDLRLLRTQFGI